MKHSLLWEYLANKIQHPVITFMLHFSLLNGLKRNKSLMQIGDLKLPINLNMILFLSLHLHPSGPFDTDRSSFFTIKIAVSFEVTAFNMERFNKLKNSLVRLASL